MKKTFTFSLLAIVFASLLSACVPHHHHRHSDGPRGPAPSGKPMPPSNGGPNHGSHGRGKVHTLPLSTALKLPCINAMLLHFPPQRSAADSK